MPGLVPVKQGSLYVAKVTTAVKSPPAPPVFRYMQLGSLATIGRKAPVADLGFVRLWDAPRGGCKDVYTWPFL